MVDQFSQYGNQPNRNPQQQQQQAGGPDFFGNTFQNVSPEMLNFGLSAGQDIISKQRERLMPGVSIFWNSLKVYFAIEITNHKWALPLNDINAPDLYIPLMSFITYVLLVGYVRGTSNKFTPEVLIHAVWVCLGLQSVETLIMKLGLNMLQVSVPLLDIFSYTGYKYVGLCFATSTLFLGQYFHIASSLYTSLMMAYFVLKTLAAVVPAVQSGGPPRHLVLLAFALMQFLLMVLLSWT